MSEPPQVFRATYSNTDVYECSMNDSPIMRRCKDDWVNATQILKCCNFPKARRTKILEKGVQSGLHEKIQGGFGRFQGTWIPLDDARRLAATYGVTKEDAPVLYLDFNDPNLIIPNKAKPVPKEPSSVKRKYVKKPKVVGDTPIKKYKTGKKAALQQAVADAAAAEVEAAATIVSANGGFPPQEAFNGGSRHPSYVAPNGQFQQMYGQPPPPPPQQQQQQPQQLVAPTNGAGRLQGGIPQAIPPQQLPPGTAPFSQNEFIPINNNMPFPNEFQNFQMQMQHQQQAQAQQQQQQQQIAKFYNGNGYSAPQSNNNLPIHYQKVPTSSQSSNDTNWSQRESDTSINSADGDTKNQILKSDNTYSAQLLKFFSDDDAEIPYFINYPPADFNINEAIDDEGHTALHWASSIGNHQMIHLLLSKGANPLVVNNFGLNPLSKLISFNNCYELKNFPKVLDDLELCLINTDINGRTPLHYLAQFSKMKSKYESLRYYLTTILNKLTTMSNNIKPELLSNVINHQDVNGDTCLHIAVRAGCTKLVKSLLQYGARDELENVQRETARLLIGQYGLIPNYNTQEAAIFQQPQQQHQPPPGPPPSQEQLLPPPPQQPQLQPPAMQLSQPPNSQILPQIQARTQREPQPYPYPVHNQLLATPIHPSRAAETPDTQRTTIQEDDEDDDDMKITAHVNKQHLDALNNNVFLDKPIVTSSPEVSRIMKMEHTPYKPNPPQLDENGKILESPSSEKKMLEMSDLKSMINGMINSLSDSYLSEMNNLNHEQNKLESLIQQKSNENRDILSAFKKIFRVSGLDIEDFDSVEQGKDIVLENIEKCLQILSEKEQDFFRVMSRNQAYSLAKLVQEQEMKYVEQDQQKGGDAVDSDQEDEEKFEQAVDLTQLQIQRNKLVKQIGERTTLFAVDDKMYKYRKLISLSCGLKVEDIDGLIDGIEESLVEGMS
ncbi:SWI4 [[Candida] subhashii]|uniref:Transcription factor MBP1 n=1 Tax=[Candida] subhashii TaxID=561895 RepID=A0A8J5QRZ8_9ASCO|nr:SWI4 [[Candida] subhashii]KAG7664222.1 SWI4 [[Candida] subhashii]